MIFTIINDQYYNIIIIKIKDDNNIINKILY
jgi:hypothetical protein